MALPWLRILDAVLGLTDLARTTRRRAVAGQDRVGRPAPPGDSAVSSVETRLAALESEQIRHEQRAERLLKLALARQAGDREIARRRLQAAVAAASWIGTLFLAGRLAGGAAGPRVLLGAGWILLLAALGLSFAAEARVARALDEANETSPRPDDLMSGVSGAIAPWLIIAGLALAGAAALV
ncbi:MAG TPA: hypothetical protein VJK49_00705 [Candidatus Limnocylindrales bacterium]|nr:hypothetical protein [Candidatus Limnocylindrales bacterium]